MRLPESATLYINYDNTEPKKLREYLYYAMIWLLPLSKSYPDFITWWRNQVRPGVAAGSWSLIIEIRRCRFAAASVLKHWPEKKLCTLRVDNRFQGRGIGTNLFEKSLLILGSDKPLLSVSEPNLDKYEKIFHRLGFSLSKTYDGLYLPGTNEYSFNGLIRK